MSGESAIEYTQRIFFPKITADNKQLQAQLDRLKSENNHQYATLITSDALVRELAREENQSRFHLGDATALTTFSVGDKFLLATEATAQQMINGEGNGVYAVVFKNDSRVGFKIGNNAQEITPSYIFKIHQINPEAMKNLDRKRIVETGTAFNDLISLIHDAHLKNAVLFASCPAHLGSLLCNHFRFVSTQISSHEPAITYVPNRTMSVFYVRELDSTLKKDHSNGNSTPLRGSMSS